MRSFEYKGFDHDGRPRNGLIEAVSIKDAREKLADTGVLVRQIHAAGSRKTGTGAPLKRDRFPSSERAVVYHELSALLKAGLPLVDALSMLVESPEQASVRSLLGAVRDDIREGASPAEGFSKVCNSVSPFEQAIMEVGERSGNLDSALAELGQFLDEQRILREKVTGALTYPLIVVVFALLVAGAVFGFVLPRVTALLEQMQAPTPLVTRIVMGAGQVMLYGSVPLVAAVILAWSWVKRKAAEDSSFRAGFDRRLFKFPYLGRGRTILANLRFSKALPVLLDGGVSLVDAVILSARATGSEWLCGMAEKAADEVRQGGSLAGALRKIEPLSQGLPGWVEAGEAGGAISSLVRKASERYQQRWDRYVARSLALLEPALVLVLGAFVLLVSVAVLSPILAMNQILQ